MAHCRDFQEFVALKQKEVESKIICNISYQLLPEGNTRYSNWGQNKRWSTSDYNHSGFCAVYFKHFFYDRARLVHQIFTHCKLEKQLPSDIFEKSLKVVSFGCGPGNDLVGFESFYHNVKTEIVQKCFKTLRKHMYHRTRKPQMRKCKKQRNFQSSYAQSQERQKRRNTFIKKWRKTPRNYTSSHVQNYGYVHKRRMKKLQKTKCKKYKKNPKLLCTKNSM